MVMSTAMAQQNDSTAIATKTKAAAHVRTIKVKGVVKEAASGKALPGMSVSVEGFSATLTNDNGEFNLSIPNRNAVIVVSGLGYQVKRLPAGGSSNRTILLYEDDYNSIYEVAVLPYANKPKTETVNSVQSVNTRGSWDRASETVDSYLQGTFSGLNAQRRSGTPGIGADLLLRGFNSLYTRNAPLIIVDGMIYDADSYGSSLISGHRTNRLANIELKDIDNITVIKDGTSLYGTRGGNGVILITTGRAKTEATRLDFAAYGGFNSTVSALPVLDANNFRVYLADVLKTQNGLTAADIQAMPFMNLHNDNSSAYWTYNQNTNWQKKVMDNGFNQNYYLKVSGGDNIATYALSVGYQSNDGLLATTGLDRYHTRFNANLNLTRKLKAQANLSFTRAEQDLRDQGRAYNTNPLYLSQIKAPFLSSNDIGDGNIASPNIANEDVFLISNPYAAVQGAQGVNRSYRFVGSTGFAYTFNKALSLNVLTGITFDKARENAFTQNEGIAPIELSTAIGQNKPRASVERLYSLYTDSWLSYQHKFSRADVLTTRVGFRFNSSKSEYDYASSYNTASDDFVTLGGAQSALRVVGGNLGKWNWLNNYLNLDYKRSNKYFFNFSLAADASSRFGKEIEGAPAIGSTKLAVLPSVGAAWLISSEPFFGNNKVVETLKLRATYGLSGNEDIGNYTAKTYYVSQNFLGRQGLVRANIGNPQLQWETVAKANVGIDAALLKERLSIAFDIYHHKTSNMLIYESLYAYNGFQGAVNNSGEMKNTGLELALNGRLINKASLKWDLGLNLNRNVNEVTSIPGNSIITDFGGATFITKKGSAANLFYGYKTNGVYRSGAEAGGSGLSNKLTDGSFVPFQGGDMRFVNMDGNSVIDENDRTVIGDPNPDIAGALTNSLNYKRWTLKTLFTFSVGNDIYNGVRANLESMSGYQNQTLNALNRWRTDGQVTSVPRAVWGDPYGNSRFSDRWIEDGSYFRLRTLSLDYDLKFKRGVKSATIYAIANNVFTVSKYLGYDPEFSASGTVFSKGVDTGLEPQFSSLQLGLRFGL